MHVKPMLFIISSVISMLKSVYTYTSALHHVSIPDSINLGNVVIYVSKLYKIS